MEASCSTILTGLSAIGSMFLVCLMVLMIVGTAIAVNLILRKFWKPVQILHYVDIPVTYDAATGRAIIVGTEKAEKKSK